jgi:hypothetical protein
MSGGDGDSIDASAISIMEIGTMPRASRRSGFMKAFLCSAVCLPLLVGCKTPASVSSPDRLVTPETELGQVRAYWESTPEIWRDYFSRKDERDQANYRNNLIAARMYAIDISYTEYESRLTHEGQLAEFAADAAVQVLNTAAPLVTPIASSKILSGVAGGIHGVQSAYVDKIWRAQLIENLQAMMRAARNDQAANMMANMRCTTGQYPLGIALSDLEAYYRAGTLPSGMLKLKQTVAKAEADSQANQQAKKPAKNNDGEARIAGQAAEAAVKSDNAKATTPGCDVRRYAGRLIEVGAKKDPNAFAGSLPPAAPPQTGATVQAPANRNATPN